LRSDGFSISSSRRNGVLISSASLLPPSSTSAPSSFFVLFFDLRARSDVLSLSRTGADLIVPIFELVFQSVQSPEQIANFHIFYFRVDLLGPRAPSFVLRTMSSSPTLWAFFSLVGNRDLFLFFKVPVSFELFFSVSDLPFHAFLLLLR